MNYFAGIPFFALLFIVSLFSYVYAQKKKNRFHRLFRLIDFPEITPVFTIILSLLFYRAVKKYDFLFIGLEEVAENLFDSLMDCVIVVNKNKKVLLYNKAADDLFHISRNNKRFDISSIVPDYDYHKEYKNLEVALAKKDTTRFFLLSHSQINKSGHELGKIVMLKDITMRKTVQNALFEEKERAFITLNSIGDAVITTDRSLKITYMNRVAEQLLGWNMLEAAGVVITEILILIHEVTREPVGNPFFLVQKKMEIISIPEQLLLVNRKGQEYHIRDSVAPIFDSNSECIGYVIVLHDVSESKKLKRQISYHASHDALTGLLNRVEFIKRLEHALEFVEEKTPGHSLFYVDIDNFKVLNDTIGHAGGDQLLKQISELLKGMVRQTDTVARVGEDEFAILLSNCSLKLGITIAEKICQKIRAHKFEYENKMVTLTMSIGVISVKPGTADVSAFLIEADEACKIACEKGGDRVNLFQSDDFYLRRHHSELEWVTKIKNALEESRLVLFYQPIVSSRSDSKEGDHFELLVRMTDDKGEIIAPARFLPAAERYNFISRIDMWVVEQFFRYYAQYYAKHGDRRLHCCSINLSGASLNDEKMLESITSLIKDYAIPPQVLCFEITETVAIANFNETARFISRLKNMGCSFALDDFGNGLSSFNYLKRLEVDYLKIDGSFVKNIVDNTKDYAIVKTINTLGHHMGLKTIAEYVQDKQTHDLLVSLGIDYVQGYYISIPEPLSELV